MSSSVRSGSSRELLYRAILRELSSTQTGIKTGTEMLIPANNCRYLLRIVGMIQLLVSVSIFVIAALRDVSAAERFGGGIGKLASMPNSKPRLQFETTIENGVMHSTECIHEFRRSSFCALDSRVDLARHLPGDATYKTSRGTVSVSTQTTAAGLLN